MGVKAPPRGPPEAPQGGMGEHDLGIGTRNEETTGIKEQCLDNCWENSLIWRTNENNMMS